jgi:very-short-patch-repair endonuclease
MSPDEAIARVAATQHGAFTTEQARAAGVTPEAMKQRRRAGRWTSRRRGVHVITGAPETWKQDVMVALLSYGGKATTSHTTSAALLGLIDQLSGPIHLILPTGHHREARRGVTVHTASLRRRDVLTIDGIRATRAERTIVDLAGVLPARALAAALDTAVTAGLTTVPVLMRYVRERQLIRLRGLAVLRKLLEERMIGVTATEFERRFRYRLKRAGLPLPVPQFQIGTRRVDFAYPDERIAIELDSIRWHLTAERFQTDRERYNELVLAGWLPLLFTWRDVNDGWAKTERTLRQALTSVA